MPELNLTQIASGQVVTQPAPVVVANSPYLPGCGPGGSFQPTAPQTVINPGAFTGVCQHEITLDRAGTWVFGANATSLEVVTDLFDYGYLPAVPNDPAANKDLRFLNYLSALGGVIYSCAVIRNLGDGDGVFSEPITVFSINPRYPLDGCRAQKLYPGCSPCADGQAMVNFDTMLPTGPYNGFTYTVRAEEQVLVQLTVSAVSVARTYESC